MGDTIYFEPAMQLIPNFINNQAISYSEDDCLFVCVLFYPETFERGA